jgi:hypothetical protein
VSGNDEALSKYIAEQYEAQGLDPRGAFDSPDDAIQDFGGMEAFR